MTKIKNGRLLLTVPAIIGMAVCIAVCILLSCLTLAGQSPARRFIFAAVFILVVLSTFSSLYTGDFKRLTKTGATDGGKPVRAVCCMTVLRSLMGRVMTELKYSPTASSMMMSR